MGVEQEPRISGWHVALFPGSAALLAVLSGCFGLRLGDHLSAFFADLLQVSGDVLHDSGIIFRRLAIAGASPSSIWVVRVAI